MKSVSIGWLGSEILTRLTATVTISAPDASTAAAFSSRLLYLPVPTMRRELNVLPATVQVSDCTDWGAFTLAPSDEMDDLVRIALIDLHIPERQTGHDLEIPLD